MALDATNSLIETARNSTSSEEELRNAAQVFFDAVSDVSREEAESEMEALSSHFDLEDPGRAAFLALVCGSLIEAGCGAENIAAALNERLASLLELSAALGTACQSRLPQAGDEEEAEDDDQDPYELFDQFRQELAPSMSRENEAWEALDIFWRPAIAAYSVSPTARESARHLRPLALEISEYHEGGQWLQMMLAVLDDEPIVVIEPETMKGLLGNFSGIVDNFQLNVLLMDGFPQSGSIPSRRVPQRVAEVARGQGPQQSEDVVTGIWNMYTWEAIEPGFNLPDPSDYDGSRYWIWNEGTPEDIPLFEGRRVVLLGPASYPRSWSSQRIFDGLPAELEIDSELTEPEVTGWLERFVAAKQDG